MWIYSKRMQFFHSIILLQEMLSNNEMSQQEIHLMLIYGNEDDASTSTQIMKVT